MKETVVNLTRVHGTTFVSDKGRRYLLGSAFSKENKLRVWQSSLDSLTSQGLAREVTHEA